MTKYECPKCKREVVSNTKSDTISIKCCSGETPVPFKKKGTNIIVPVAKLPEGLSEKPQKPLPLSVPEGDVTPKASAIIPAK